MIMFNQVLKSGKAYTKVGPEIKSFDAHNFTLPFALCFHYAGRLPHILIRAKRLQKF